MYNHQQKDPIRIYMRSASAHNVPFVPGAKTRRRPNPTTADWGLTPLAPRTDGERFSACAVSRMYKGLAMRRDVRVGADGMIEIEDAVLEGEPRRLYSLWHVPRNKRVRLIRNGALVIGTGKRMRIEVEDLTAPGPIGRARYIGRAHERFWSLHSPTFNVCVGSAVIVFGPLAGRTQRYRIGFEDLSNKTP